MATEILKELLAPAKWLYSLVAEQTRITIVGADSPDAIGQDMNVVLGAEGDRFLLFGITTQSKVPIEILEVCVRYSTPLQMYDPGQRGFFVLKTSTDPDFPFALHWTGTAEVTNKLLLAFTLRVEMPEAAERLPIHITVHARKTGSSLGRFRRHGRVQVLDERRILAQAQEPQTGIPIPPGCGLTTSAAVPDRE